MPSDMRKTSSPAASAVCVEMLESRVFLTVASAITIEPNLSITPMVTSASPVGGYTPAQIRAAYGFNQISINGAAGDGSGQTIAIIGAYNDPNIASDLAVFNRQYGLSSANLKVVSQTGGSVSSIATDGGWASELALDVEWAHAMAPKANILVVEAKTASLTNLLAAVDYARKTPGVSVVSMSWGGSEFWGQSAYDSYFTTPAGHQGVTFVAASGDSGSWWGPSWPATSPNVLGVGGTSLYLSSTGAYAGESGWSGSGGGISSVVSEPSYQTGVQNTGARTSPDVSYNANPNTGFAYYSSVPYYGYSGWDIVGGTSAGTPQWAAIIAIANQARAANHLGSLDGATGTLPALYALYNDPTAYAAAFHDVTTGASSWFFAAGTGYDAVTGLGTPKANGVVAVLSKATTVTAAKTQVTIRVRPQAVRLLATGGSTDTSTVTVIPPAIAAARPALQLAGRNVLNAVLDTRPAAGAIGATPVALASIVTSASITTGDLPGLNGVFATAPLTRLIQTVEALPAQATAMAPAVAGSAAVAVTDSVQSVAAAIPAAVSPAGVAAKLYNIPRLDVVGAFADAWDSLAEESAAAPREIGAMSNVRAWMVTAAVASADAALAAYWLIRRRKIRKAVAVGA